MVTLVILFPHLMIPSDNFHSLELLVLLAGLTGVLVWAEYASLLPCLISFRDAPPVNRLRFAFAVMMVVVVTAVFLNEAAPTNFTMLIASLGHNFGQVFDVPYTPVYLFFSQVPIDGTEQSILSLRGALALSYALSMILICVFVLTVKFKGWPHRKYQFNVWVNLPMFNPAGNGDVLFRLRREACLCIALGFTLPFLAPVVLGPVMSIMGSALPAQSQGVVWIICIWAFVPANLVLRGVAVLRVAELVMYTRKVQAAVAAERAALIGSPL
jgi:hypothetical protein